MTPTTLNYLSIQPEPIKPFKYIAVQMAVPFEQWLLNDGYQPRLIKHHAVVRFIKTNKQSIEINSNGVLNEPGRKRYAIFLQQYFKKGHGFISALRTQAPKLMKVA